MANTLGPAKIIYQGPSHLPGVDPKEEIIAVITFGSKNGKTGDFWTIFLFPSSVLSLKTKGGGLLKHLTEGGDQGVCQGCIHGSKGDKDCYTYPLMFKGNSRMIDSLQQRIQKGQNVRLTPEALALLIMKHKPMIRFGGYGDPVAMPLWLSLHIVQACEGRLTGYTHVWNRIPLDDRGIYQQFLMASVDSQMQAQFARAKGWRTFRVGQEEYTQDRKAEFNCPASKEMKAKIGKEITCFDCGKCNGKLSSGVKSVYIKTHGAFANRYKPLNVLIGV